MEHNGIKYSKIAGFLGFGNKYRLDRDYQVKTNIKGCQITKMFYSLSSEGMLSVQKGYLWNGPSGPTVDTKNFMRGSMIHDIVYDMLRKQLLPSWVRAEADLLLFKTCREDGMSMFRATYVYRGVANFARLSSLPGGGSKMIVA